MSKSLYLLVRVCLHFWSTVGVIDHLKTAMKEKGVREVLKRKNFFCLINSESLSVCWTSTVEGMRKSSVLLNLPARLPRAFLLWAAFSVCWSTQLAGLSERRQRKQRLLKKPSLPGLIMETWLMPQYVFLYLFHMKLLMQCTQSHRVHFHIFSIELREFFDSVGDKSFSAAGWI